MVAQSKSFTISEVRVQPEGAGFAIGDGAGAPIVTFSYLSRAEAEAARKCLAETVAAASGIRGYERSAPAAVATIPLDNLNASNDE